MTASCAKSISARELPGEESQAATEMLDARLAALWSVASSSAASLENFASAAFFCAADA
jgi:hypothetical protein